MNVLSGYKYRRGHRPSLSSLPIPLERNTPYNAALTSTQKRDAVFQEKGRKGEDDVLRDEEDIDSAQIEIIEIGHGRHAFSTSVHTSVKLGHISIITGEAFLHNAHTIIVLPLYCRMWHDLPTS
jgi:hypothetical protein